MKKLVPRYQKGGYSPNTNYNRIQKFIKWEPSSGFDPVSFVLSSIFHNVDTGEEDEYYKEYLGLTSGVPKMNSNAYTEWDKQVEQEKKDKGEQPSDFYGTTPRMDLSIQALADTLNLSKIVRNYDYYKQQHPEMPDKKIFENTYKQSKTVLENPNKWHQINADETYVISNPEGETERNPLGMLSSFGLKWDGSNLYMHDTYDFPTYVKIGTGIPERPREMKIRSKISFDPKKGSVLLRNNLQNYKLPPMINKSKYDSQSKNYYLNDE